MPLSLVIEPLAEADVEAIFEYIRQGSPEGAVSWYNAFQAAAHRTVQMPESYPLAAENSLLNRDVRNFLFKTRLGDVWRLPAGLFDECAHAANEVPGPQDRFTQLTL